MPGRILFVVTLCVFAVTPARALPESASAVERHAWDALHRSSQPGLVAAAQIVLEPADATPSALPRVRLEEVVRPAHAPRIIVVGFTGGVERHDSAVSGVVRLREAVGGATREADVRALTYNNFRWRRAVTDVVELARWARAEAAPAHAPAAGGPASSVLPSLPQPLIIVYGHSWGGGSIAKFARLLREEGLDISLAVYIDAFTMRNPRVPDNVRYAVNFYQRTGILRGLPLRGKRQLIPESPEVTEILGSYRLRPDTDHFGWNWNIIQPLLYRHHHRISHDVRLQRYLVETVGVLLETAAAEPASPSASPLAAAGT